MAHLKYFPSLVPWFRRWPRVTLAVSAALFGAIFLARMAGGGAVQATALLFCLPIALVAVAFGLRAGLGAGVVGLTLLAIWALTDDVGLSVVGWAARVTPMLLLGGLLGQASDRLRDAERENVRLADVARRHRDAVELNDSVVQRLAAAKWALEAGRTEQALDVLVETLDYAQALVSDLLHDADVGRCTTDDAVRPRPVPPAAATTSMFAGPAASPRSS